ncbi:hypothetical protein SB14R_17120 [Pseudomonas oryzihabitans]|nr:hypothetical protein NS376_15655 [Pseudomonas psychrotolerans]KTT22347.1 hypothetical protein SB14R_17120 [Pseudomonas psychrotolerans]KTT57923.1 hypothetical protein SB8_11095 [Pseudomonas psychrotolerans]
MAPPLQEGRPIQEDLRLQRWIWRCERLGWALLGLFVVLALGGLFASGGPWATATRVSDDGQLKVQYERFQRRGAPTTLTLELAPGVTRVGLDERLVADWTVEALYPQPARMTSSDGVLWLDLTPGGGPGRLHLALRPDALGTVNWRILRPGRVPLSLSAFIYP